MNLQGLVNISANISVSGWCKPILTNSVRLVVISCCYIVCLFYIKSSFNSQWQTLWHPPVCILTRESTQLLLMQFSEINYLRYLLYLDGWWWYVEYQISIYLIYMLFASGICVWEHWLENLVVSEPAGYFHQYRQ